MFLRQKKKLFDEDAMSKDDDGKKSRSPSKWSTPILLLFGSASLFVLYHILGTEYHMFSIQDASQKLLTRYPSTSVDSEKVNVDNNDIRVAVAFDSSFTKSCTAEEASKQGSLIPAAKVRGCPPEDDGWMRFTQAIIPKARVFLDIGSNKGYSAARIFELWSPEFGLNSRLLHGALKQVTSEPELLECGACNDCHEEGDQLVPILPRYCSSSATTSGNANVVRALQKAVSSLCQSKAANFKPLRIYSFDGNPMMVDGVTAARNWLADHDAQHSTLNNMASIPSDRLPESPKKRFLKSAWTLELGAFSEKYEEGKIVEFVLGVGEKGHLAGDEMKLKASETSEKRAKVPLVTIDHILQRENLAHVDIIKIDTEGHDPSVLQGAQETLRSGKATVVIFEYNKMWPRETTLESIVIDMMEPFKYSCYLEGKSLLLKLNFGCWTSSLEIREWSNVWCISLRRPDGIALAAVFDSYSMAFI